MVIIFASLCCSDHRVIPTDAAKCCSGMATGLLIGVYIIIFKINTQAWI